MVPALSIKVAVDREKTELTFVAGNSPSPLTIQSDAVTSHTLLDQRGGLWRDLKLIQSWLSQMPTDGAVSADQVPGVEELRRPDWCTLSKAISLLHKRGRILCNQLFGNDVYRVEDFCRAACPGWDIDGGWPPVIEVTAGLRDFDRRLEQAAEGLGASRWRTLGRITLPLLRPSLVSAGLLAFISSFDELVVALFLAGPNMTLPKKMFDNILMEIDPTIAAVSVMQILLVTLVMVLIGRFGRGLRGSAR